jgi:hypothetical protein
MEEIVAFYKKAPKYGEEDGELSDSQIQKQIVFYLIIAFFTLFLIGLSAVYIYRIYKLVKLTDLPLILIGVCLMASLICTFML